MRSQILALGLLLLAIGAWCGFGYLVTLVHADRASYANAASSAAQESARGESTARLHSTIQGTEVERAALESIIRVSIVDAVETIEMALKQAGASDIQIGEATPLTTSPQGLFTVSVVVTAGGSFVALLRAAGILEVLPVPSQMEQFEISKTDKAWRLSARLKVTLAGQK